MTRRRGVNGYSGGTWEWSYGHGTTAVAVGTGGLLTFGPLLMILFRQKYPRWYRYPPFQLEP